MRKFVSLLLISFLINTFYLSEGYAFVESYSAKICHCNHSSEKEIHYDEDKITLKVDSDCHTSKKKESHRCLCKTSKSKKNSNLKVPFPIFFEDIITTDPSLSHQKQSIPDHIIKFLGYEIFLLKPPKN